MRNLRHIIWVLLILFSLTACIDTSRQPISASDYLPNIYTVEIWSEHEYYELGEPINLRATLTNVSTESVTFGSESGTTPVMDIQVGIFEEQRFWAEENPDKVRHIVTLAPGESYVITWALSLSLQERYGIQLSWVDSREGSIFVTGFSISHGKLQLTP